MDLDRDFSEFIASCAAHDVRYLVVGGYAVAAHGYPRFTQDLDVWVWLDEQNADRLISADDLIMNKKASGRPQDIADVAVLTDTLTEGDA